jgi:hypothetical protein
VDAAALASAGAGQRRRGGRGFRGPALGRNNFYGSHPERGTQGAAIIYSLVESAKLNGVEPKRYLKTALTAALEGNRIPLPHELRAVP